MILKTIILLTKIRKFEGNETCRVFQGFERPGFLGDSDGRNGPGCEPIYTINDGRSISKRAGQLGSLIFQLCFKRSDSFD